MPVPRSTTAAAWPEPVPVPSEEAAVVVVAAEEEEGPWWAVAALRAAV
ncbi:MAG TPA: hypothetical protein VIJ09_02600 [Acidimicrobiales bacterium]